MNTTISKNRSSYWDNIKGILILLTVFAHILFQLQEQSEVINKTVDFIYMFHMPAFVFVSGFFGKSEHSHSFENIIKLIFLYFIFNSVMGFIYGFSSLLQPMYSYWYLLALIVWRLTAHHIAKFKKINLILFVIALLVGFYPSIDNTFAVSRIICFYPYYMVGYLLSKEKIQKLIEIKYIKRFGIGILCSIFTFELSFFAYELFKYTDSDLQMGGYLNILNALGRIALYIIAFGAISAICCISPNKKIPLLTEFGKNSLWIFVFHRIFTLVASDSLKPMTTASILFISIGLTIFICILFGNFVVAKYMDKFLSLGVEIFTSNQKRRFNPSKLALLFVSLIFIIQVIVNSYSDVNIEALKNLINNTPKDEKVVSQVKEEDDDIIYPIMTDTQKSQFDNAFRITFAGDLILLEDQVKRAYNGKGYDFTDVFEYAKPYISSADFAIGVFEGPMAGEEEGYSTSNFNDDKELYLNFPDSFASAVKDTGFDLVTNANNHLLDKGEKGALRTINILDKIGLDHTGSYKSAEDKKNNHIKLVECQGIKIAVLSYTYGCNYIDNALLTNGNYKYLTSVIYGTEGEEFELLKQNVQQDFADAKALKPDLIVVLPHIGTQFSNSADEEQQVWFDIFKENGADIILGDHPHAVEPAVIEKYGEKNVFTAYCPGNFANIYREDQGDTSMLVDVYIDRKSKEIVGGSIVPLYTHARADGNYRAVPIYDIMTKPTLREQLTTDDIELAINAHNIISNVVFGYDIDISSITERYYFDENGFVRKPTTGLKLTDEMKKGALYTAIEKASSICFVGDSVTEGTKNGGCPWYEPIEEYISEKKIYNYSKGGCTVSYILDHSSEIPDAELYVIALGTNDVRYRDETMCAMTSDEYIKRINELKNKFSNNKKFIFIAPWYSTDGDPFCDLSYTEKTALNDEYSLALKKYCTDNSLGFINANDYLKNKLKTSPQKKYLLDHIHPNSSNGVILYSEAILSARNS